MRMAESTIICGSSTRSNSTKHTLLSQYARTAIAPQKAAAEDPDHFAAAEDFVRFVNSGPSPYHGMYCDLCMCNVVYMCM